MPPTLPHPLRSAEISTEAGLAAHRGEASIIDFGRVRAPDRELERQLELILKTRASRFKHFPADLFADPAWDLLLTLALAELKQHRLTISNLCDSTNVPSSTAARWIRSLTETGWLVRRDCPNDARVKYIELSLMASRKVRDYVAESVRIWS